MRILRGIVCAAALGLVIAACQQPSPVSGPGNPPPGPGIKKVTNRPCRIVVEIQDGNIYAPRAVGCGKGGAVALVFVNYDDTPYTVTIDPTKIVDKYNATPNTLANPFDTTNRFSKTLRKDVETFKAHISSNADSNITYKYTIHCDECAVKDFDPDIEIMM